MFAAPLLAWLDDEARMGSVDRAWLRMDDPANLMVVNALLRLDGPLTRAQLLEHVAGRLTWIPRMRLQVEAGRWLERWTERPLELDAHVCVHGLAPPGDDTALRKLVSELISEPLPHSRPLWQLHLIEGHGEGATILARVHHSLGDGLALLLVLLSLTDTDADGRAPNPLHALFAGGGREAVTAAREFVGELMPAGVKLMLHHDHLALAGRTKQQRHGPLAGAARLGRIGSAVARDLAALLLRRPDSHTVFRGPLGRSKLVAWSRALELEHLHDRAHAMGMTINDLLLSATTGGLRRYLIARGQDPEGFELRSAVPINLRELAEIAKLGNRFGLVFVELPVGIADPKARLAELHRRMDALKHSVEPVVTWGLLELMGSSPKLVESLMLSYFAARVSFVMTNVPGPERHLYLAGRRLEDLMFWVPQSGRVGLGVSLISYAGTVRIGVACDAKLVPDPDRLVAALETELDALLEVSARARP